MLQATDIAYKQLEVKCLDSYILGAWDESWKVKKVKTTERTGKRLLGRGGANADKSS